MLRNGMRPTVRLPLLTLLVLAVISSASATTYYIAANGSDSNNGTSKNTPWLHAPGMKTCSSACASANPKPGDQFIFRGGDTWHFGASTAPSTGGTWTWSWSGSSTGCNYPGATSACIYIGVDQTWFSGSSWVR